MLNNPFPSLNFGALPVVKNNRLYILNPEPEEKREVRKKIRISMAHKTMRPMFDKDGYFVRWVSRGVGLRI